MRRQNQKSTRKARNIWIQERDLQMLLSIGTARMLTAQMLEWLHFSTWRARYKAALERAQQEAKAPTYRPVRQVHERLAGLVQHGFLTRITRTTERGSTHFQRLPDVYALTSKGADLLCEMLGAERRELSLFDRRIRAIQNLEHCVAIGQVYASLRAQLERDELPFGDWTGDHQLRRDYDRVTISGRHDETGVVPDATCTISNQRYFIEVDRGTRPIRSWAEKAYVYDSYHGSGKLRARYDTDTFRVLVIAPNKTRLHRIASGIARINREPTQMYIFIPAHLVHPTTIRTSGSVLARVALTSKHVVDKLVETADVMFRSHSLWEKPNDAD